MIFVGIDWAEEHHDVHVMDPDGRALGSARVPEGIEGVGRLHALVADHAEDPAEAAVGIETDRGLLVTSLVAAGYQVYAVNPRAVDRYRDRHSVSGAKSDGGDAKVLADLVRTDRHNHRQVAGDSDPAEAIKVTARAHQSLVWTRQRQVNQLRSTLREYYPGALAVFGTDLAHRRGRGAGQGADARAGSAALHSADHLGAAPRRPRAQPRPARSADPRRAARPAAGRPRRGG